MSYKTQLEKLGACAEGIEWAGEKTLEQIYAECPRIDLLLWLAGRLQIDPKKSVRIACECARLALPYVAAEETRPLAAIELAENWAAGDESITIDDLRGAAAAAYAAADDAGYAAANAGYAARAAAYAVVNAAADDAADAANAAANAAYAACAAAAGYAAAGYAAANAYAAAANAADAAANAAANAKLKTKCLEIFRKHITLEDFIEADKKIQKGIK